MSAVDCAQPRESETSFGESGVLSLCISLLGVKGWEFCLEVDLLD